LFSGDVADVAGHLRVVSAEADAEGGLESGGGVEAVLAFEDGVAEAGDAAGDAVEIGVGWSGVWVRFRGVEDHLAGGGVAGDFVEIAVGEGAPIAFGLFVELVEVVSDLAADALEVCGAL
jgi:hypothetical protein